MDFVAALNQIGERGAELPPEVAGWSPVAVTIPAARGLHGFAASDTPKVLGRWLAWARAWAVPSEQDAARATSTEKLASQMQAVLSSVRYTVVVRETWEALMQLFRDGSSFTPVPWAWWRYTNCPSMSPYGVFSPKVITEAWQRKKFWDEVGGQFGPKTKLWPLATVDLIKLKKAATVTGHVDLELWGKLLDIERTQRAKIMSAVNAAQEKSNLAMWLTDGDNLLKALRIKVFATTEV